MKYQKTDLHNGRKCDERWNFIKKHLCEKYCISLDIGSAEGIFSNYLVKTLSNTIVISIEGSKYCQDRQEIINEEYIKNKRITLMKTVITNNTIDKIERIYDNSLLLSVLHWFEEPDIILKKISGISLNTFIELPNLDDKNSYNQDYLIQIKNKYKTIDNYITTITKCKIIDKMIIASHTGVPRTIYVIVNKELLKHTIHPKTLLRNRYDIYIKYLYIKSLINNENIEVYKNIYKNHLQVWNNFKENNKQTFNDFNNSFIKLINDFKEHNFNNIKSPIPVNNILFPLNGAHRIACSLFFNRYIYIKFENKKQAIWDKNYFIKCGMKKEYIDIIDNDILIQNI